MAASLDGVRLLVRASGGCVALVTLKGTPSLKSPTQAAQPYRHRRRTMGDDNVIVLDVLTTINLPPERILNAALEADLAALVVVGYDKNGQYYFHSSIPHGSTINWLLDQCKKRIIDEPSDMRGEPGTEEGIFE
jgi:hypothetical protein